MTSAHQKGRRGGRPIIDTVAQHRDWLALVEVSGPFLSLPVLRRTWPTLDAIEPAEREQLRREHGVWRADGAEGRTAWVEHVVRELLGWGEGMRIDGLDALTVEVPEHDAVITPTFALVESGSDGGPMKPDSVRLLGIVCDGPPTARVADSAWAATPVDRLAQLCRHHDVELGVATDGRWWALVWAPRGKVTTTAVFDAVAWPEAAERDVVRAFRSMLRRSRFLGVTENETLPALLKASEDAQEDITEALGVQVRQAVELLVAAIGRADVREREAGGPGLEQVSAHDVYRGAVSVMMRVVFLLFAEERGLLPSDNELYRRAYSAGGLCAELEQRALEGTEEELENSQAAWHRLLALFLAVYDGIDHPRLRMHAHDGSLFDPGEYPWMPLSIDDRTVLHMLRAVQYVEVGTGRNRERRTLSFRQLDVEQIGYVYEGLLSFEGFRADGVVLGLVGKQGLEEEVALADMEAINGPALAATLAEKYKASGIGSVKALEKRLAPLGPVEQEDARKKLLAVTGGDYPLAERLLPLFGIIRRDLRDLPVVILPGALYVTESALRRNTGTHYTPRFLAEEVVEHALEPLLYHNGPLQTADKTQWTHKKAKEILQLKVADIAMGSAAFLVAAARYLGDALLAAWVREGTVTPPAEDDGTRPLDADEDPLAIDARRQIIEHCLYGVDINPMAVEMAKLSLWLVSMDNRRPFTFLDDRLVAGDSLLGITDLEQLEYLNLNPAHARELNDGALTWLPDVRGIVAHVADLRRQITEIELGDDPLAALDLKRALLEDVRAQTGQLRLFADLTVGAALAGCKKWGGSRDPNLRDAIETDKRVSRDGLYFEAVALAERAAAGEGEFKARQKRREWLQTDSVPGTFDREPLHWPLVFPEVFDHGGFDAVIGNPPFLGGTKITGSLGVAYRNVVIDTVAGGLRAGGRCDLVAYFVLRSEAVLSSEGQIGIVATNTLAQGDTREVALDRLVASGHEIRRAIKSEPWPSRSAALEYCAVWITRVRLCPEVVRFLDGQQVAEITSALARPSRVRGGPLRLAFNAEMFSLGSKLDGMGFILSADEVELLVTFPANAEVIERYLTGQDINSRPDCSAARWVINFRDRSEAEARAYPECWRRVEQLVRPERAKHGERNARTYWWRFQRSRPELYRAIEHIDRVIVMAQTSSTVMPVFVPARQVFSTKCVVFTSAEPALLSLLASSSHYFWTLRCASTLKTDVSYTPSDVFQTLPLPTFSNEMRSLGKRLDGYRQDLMLARNAGLTKTYNLVFDPAVTDSDIVELRRIHEAIDQATVRAYGWHDIVDRLDHGFHLAGRGLRHTIGPAAQREILDRLLELNHQRYAKEVNAGLHEKKGRKPAAEGLF